MSKDELKPLLFEVEDIKDLVRLSISSSSSIINPPEIFHVKQGNTHYYFCLVSIISLSGGKSIPAVYYYRSEKEVKGPYALLKNDNESEKIEFSETARRGWTATVIINLKKVPSEIKFE